MFIRIFWKVVFLAYVLFLIFSFYWFYFFENQGLLRCDIFCVVDNFSVLNIFSAFNWYHIDGVYHYMEMKNIFMPLFIFIPFGFIFAILYEKNFSKTVFWIALLFSVWFAVLQLFIAYISLLFSYQYKWALNIWEIPFYIAGFLIGFFICYIFRFLLFANDKNKIPK